MLNYVENPLFLTQVINDFVKELEQVSNSLKIYAGEAYCVIFDDDRVVSALRNLKKRNSNMKIQMVVGPVLSRSGSISSPELIKLNVEGVIDLYYRPQRGREGHFRILDDKKILYQPWHNPAQQLNRRAPHQLISRDEEPVKFKAYAEEFANYMKDENKYPAKKFVLLQTSELRELAALANKVGKEFDLMTQDQILDLRKQVIAYRKAQKDEELRWINGLEMKENEHWQLWKQSLNVV